MINIQICVLSEHSIYKIKGFELSVHDQCEIGDINDMTIE